MVKRKIGLSTCGLALLGSLVIAFGSLPAAHAQDNPKFNVDYYRPSVHPGDILGILTATEPDHLAWSAGLWFTLNNKPLSIVDATTGNKIWGAVTNQFVLDLYGSIALWDFLDIGVDIPLFLASMGDSPSAGSAFAEVSGFSLGDVRLGIKGTFLGGRGKGFGLALAEDITFPTATKKVFSGDNMLTGTTNLIVDYSKQGWTAALNVGFRARKAVTVGDFKISHELLLGLGLNAPLICNVLELVGTAEARTQASKPFGEKYGRALDLMGGIRGKIGPVLLTAAGGGGVLEGYASPNYRVTVQAGYQGAVDKGCVKDTDKDKIPDETDRCPTEFGTAEFQGCPDRDGDGVVDIDDQCPDVPGVASLKGCPDADKDGIEDSKDKCPNEAGLKQFQGCPDKDKDGVQDKDDSCPDVAGLAALKGCPDKDKDGIADDDDQCPDVAGKAEFNGCPPPTPSRVKVTKEKIEILEIVLFETGKDKIRPESFGLLDDVAKVLNDYPNIKKIRVEGHTDNVGNKKKNLKLSAARAKSVMTYLVGKGVVEARLVSEGYGDTKPIADNKTKEGKAKNRRVEFSILEQD